MIEEIEEIVERNLKDIVISENLYKNKIWEDQQLLNRLNANSVNASAVIGIAEKNISAIKKNIIDFLKNKFSQAVPNMREPCAVITIGCPGSGKTFAQNDAMLDLLGINDEYMESNTYLVLDQDEIISFLLNLNIFRGKLTSIITDLAYLALKNRYNFIYCSTGRDYEYTRHLINRFKTYNYTVGLCIVSVRFQTAKERTSQRFLNDYREGIIGRPVNDIFFNPACTSITRQTLKYVALQKTKINSFLKFVMGYEESDQFRLYVYDNDVSGRNAIRIRDPIQIAKLLKDRSDEILHNGYGKQKKKTKKRFKRKPH
jgi:hypothetical protein